MVEEEGGGREGREVEMRKRKGGEREAGKGLGHEVTGGDKKKEKRQRVRGDEGRGEGRSGKG